MGRLLVVEPTMDLVRGVRDYFSSHDIPLDIRFDFYGSKKLIEADQPDHVILAADIPTCFHGAKTRENSVDIAIMLQERNIPYIFLENDIWERDYGKNSRLYFGLQHLNNGRAPIKLPPKRSPECWQIAYQVLLDPSSIDGQ